MFVRLCNIIGNQVKNNTTHTFKRTYSITFQHNICIKTPISSFSTLHPSTTCSTHSQSGRQHNVTMTTTAPPTATSSLAQNDTFSRSFSTHRHVTQSKPPLSVLRLNVPIWDQLVIEEALFRADQPVGLEDHSWCVLNQQPDVVHGDSIVLGISGKPEEWVCHHAADDYVPMIQRFSGGGTVYVDHRTAFVTFVCNHGLMKEAYGVKKFPQPILDWSGQFYQGVFDGKTSVDEKFHVVDNDYCLGSRKIGGNAQSLAQHRWLHHTSFLWDMDMEKINRYLLPPPVNRRPKHRRDREHSEFVASMKHVFPSVSAFHDQVVGNLSSWFDVREGSLDDIQGMIEQPHRKRLRRMAYPPEWLKRSRVPPEERE
jgi:lipoate---protein ligase